MEDMFKESIDVLIMFADMFGVSSILVSIMEHYQMMPITTVITLLFSIIAILWIIKELSKAKPVFNSKNIDTVVNEQKAITKVAKAEDVF